MQSTGNVECQESSFELEPPVDHRCNAAVHFGSVAGEVGVEAKTVAQNINVEGLQ